MLLGMRCTCVRASLAKAMSIPLNVEDVMPSPSWLSANVPSMLSSIRMPHCLWVILSLLVGWPLAAAGVAGSVVAGTL